VGKIWIAFQLRSSGEWNIAGRRKLKQTSCRTGSAGPRNSLENVAIQIQKVAVFRKDKKELKGGVLDICSLVGKLLALSLTVKG